MLLIVFFLKVWFYKLNTDFTSSHSENKLTVYHDLKRLLVDVHWAFLRLDSREISKGWRDDQVGECRFASVRELLGGAIHPGRSCHLI